MTEEITLRPAVKEDMPSVFDLIMELAIYEKGEDKVTSTVKDLEENGFGENPIFGTLVAERSHQIVGISLYYYRYSTWKGKIMYLEDLVVTERERGSGIGKRLFDQTVEIAKSTGCNGMTWQVLDWNEPAIKFYETYQAEFDGEWINCLLRW